MERSRAGQFESSKDEKELATVADAILLEYKKETEQSLFDLLIALKAAEPGGEVARLFGDWTHRDRIDLQDVIFWKLSKTQREAYQQFVQTKK